MLALDLSAIVAGSGIRGQFEEKFKALLRDIEEEVCLRILIGMRELIRPSFMQSGNVICFIDELRQYSIIRV